MANSWRCLLLKDHTSVARDWHGGRVMGVGEGAGGRGWGVLVRMGMGPWIISFQYFSWQFYVREELGFAFMSVYCMLGFHYRVSIHVRNILQPYALPLLLFLIYSPHMEATPQKLGQQACFCKNSSRWKCIQLLERRLSWTCRHAAPCRPQIQDVTWH